MKIQPVFNINNPINQKVGFKQQPKTNNNITFNKPDFNLFYYPPLIFKGAKIPLYLINKKGEFTKFNSQSECSNYLGCSYSSVCTAIKNGISTLNGFGIIKASDVELKDEEGKTFLDIDKINEIAQGIKEEGYYIVNASGEYRKFSSAKEIASYLECNVNNIYQLLANKGRTIRGYGIIKADEVEAVVDGETKIDFEKLKEVAKDVNTDIYVIQPDGTYKKFKTQAQIAQYLNCPEKGISYALNGKQKTVKGCLLKKASEVEFFDKYGTFRVDEQKIKELIKNNDTHLYVIKDGKYTKFSSRKEAAQYIGSNISAFGHLAQGNAKLIKGYIVALASDVETENDDGESVVDEKRIKEISININKSFYLISPEGKYKKFSSRKEAADYLGCNETNLSTVIQNCHKTIRGYSVLKASEVEFVDEEGNIVVDERKIQEHLKSFDKGIYLISKYGIYGRFDSPKAAQETLGINQTNIISVLNGRLKSIKGFYVVRAKDVEKINDEGKSTLDLNEMTKLIEDKGIAKDLKEYED